MTTTQATTTTGAAPTTTPAATTTAVPSSPHASEAEGKAVAKTAADTTVSTDKHARHGVVYTMKSPKVWASAAAGAAIGLPFGGPVGAAVGAGVGLLVQRYGILGGPAGRAIDFVKSKLGKK